MSVRRFVVEVDRAPSQAQLGRLFARCDDLCVESNPARPPARILVDRPAPTLVDAIVSVIRDLDAVGLVASQVGVDDDLVPVELIAERVGRAPAVVEQWRAGEATPGGFPPPVGDALFRWSDVTRWLADRMAIEVADPEPTVAAVNLGLRLRAMGPTVERMAAIRGLISG